MATPGRASGVSPGAALLIGLGGFVAGVVVTLSSSQAPSPAVAASTAAAPSPSADLPTALPEPVTEPTDPSALSADELAALTTPPPIGRQTLSSLSAVDWAAYKTDFVAKNPGLAELDGFAPLVSEEFAKSDASLSVDQAMTAAMQRAASRWMDAQRAQAAQTYPDLPLPDAQVPGTAVVAQEEDADAPRAGEDAGSPPPF